jgi:hypothetical protein
MGHAEEESLNVQEVVMWVKNVIVVVNKHTYVSVIILVTTQQKRWSPLIDAPFHQHNIPRWMSAYLRITDENVGEECRRRLSLGGSWWVGQSYRTPLAVQDGQASKE